MLVSLWIIKILVIARDRGCAEVNAYFFLLPIKKFMNGIHAHVLSMNTKLKMKSNIEGQGPSKIAI